MNRPTIEVMRQELLGAGWKPICSTIWKSPNGLLYYGPAKAWHVMMGLKLRVEDTQ